MGYPNLTVTQTLPVERGDGHDQGRDGDLERLLHDVIAVDRHLRTYLIIGRTQRLRVDVGGYSAVAEDRLAETDAGKDHCKHRDDRRHNGDSR